jgi:hypothetical protein
MSSNDMPDEIVIFRNSNGGIELGPAPEFCDWLINTKYVRHDLCAAPAAQDIEVQTIIDIVNKNSEPDEYAQEIIDLFHPIKAVTRSLRTPAPTDNAEALEALRRIERSHDPADQKDIDIIEAALLRGAGEKIPDQLIMAAEAYKVRNNFADDEDGLNAYVIYSEMLRILLRKAIKATNEAEGG